MTASAILPSVIGCISMILVMWATYLAVESWALSVKRAQRVAMMIILAVSAFFAWTIVHMLNRFDGVQTALTLRFIDWLMDTFPVSSIVLPLVETVLLVAATASIRRTRRSLITPDSVKEAVDALPDGICFSAEDGTPILANELMGELANDVFGVPLDDEHVLWDRLCTGDCLPGYSIERTDTRGGGEGILLVAADGRAWQFSRRNLEVDGVPTIETIAADVAEEYSLVRKLEDRNRHLADVNERLRAYGRNLAQLTREEEILSLKAYVHEEVGRALLALRTYERQDPSQRNREALLGYWHGVAHLLESSAKEESMDSWELLAKAADAIGVDLRLSGELPAEKAERDLAVMVVHECLNNAVRHGDAHRVDVTCSVDDDAVVLTITNDGALPAEPPADGGGLANIRAILERADGTLTAKWDPQVAVTARFGRVRAHV